MRTEGSRLDKPKILLVVEGSRTEVKFFTRFVDEFAVNAEIVPYHTNIYSLYQELEREGFNVSLVKILQERAKSESERKILREKFVGTYLIYDCDPQHDDLNLWWATRWIKALLNMRKLQKLVRYFANDTDESGGRLFINYPMMEAYRDCDSFSDPSYHRTVVTLRELCKRQYKSRVSRRRSQHNTAKLTLGEFQDIVRQSLFKLSFLLLGKWGPFPYMEFRNANWPSRLLGRELLQMFLFRRLSVINTSVLFVLDYRGNKDGFYDSIANIGECRQLGVCGDFDGA